MQNLIYYLLLEIRFESENQHKYFKTGYKRYWKDRNIYLILIIMNLSNKQMDDVT